MLEPYQHALTHHDAPPHGFDISSMSLEVRQLDLVAGGTWGEAAEIKRRICFNVKG